MFADPILEAWITAVDAAIAKRPELAPWFTDRETLIAASHMLDGYAYEADTPLTEHDALERSAILLAGGRVAIERPDGEVIREASAPTTLGAFGFAIGRRRTATVRALEPSVAVHLNRAGLHMISKRSPDVAVGLLRWMALDLVDWLMQTRGRRDVWSQQHGMAGTERLFEQLPPGRHPVQAGAPHQRAADRIKALTCFGGADASPLTEGLGDQVHLVAVDAGACVVSHGDADRSLLVLLEGTASVRNRDGEVLGAFRAGANIAADVLIGELAFLTDTGRDGTVIADTDCALLEIPADAAPWIARHAPELAVRMHTALIATICWRIREQDLDRDRTAAILAGDFDAWLGA